jgi:hypothetical protein
MALVARLGLSVINEWAGTPSSTSRRVFVVGVSAFPTQTNVKAYSMVKDHRK